MNNLKSIIHNSQIAFDVWRKKSAWERAEILKEWQNLILKNKSRLAKLMNAESGKILSEAISEIELTASYIEWNAEEAKRVYGEIISSPNTNTNAKSIFSKQPIGVVAAITPWNFPAAMITRKAAPALAAGCTVVCKPSEETPKIAIELQKLAVKAGMPKGVFEIVTGNPEEIGKEFTSNPIIKKLSFTGSTAVGKKLMAACASSVKKVTMELGGNAPFIVFDDADLEKAVEAGVRSRFRNAGQTCICANRFLVHKKIHDKFVKLLTTKVKQLEIGRLINKKAVEKVDELVKSCGGKIICGGNFKGLQYEPTIICDLKPTSKIFAAEIFGPVAAIYKFKTEAEVIRLANNTEYGLAAFIFSDNLAKAWRVADELEYGMVGVNDISISTAHSPFGGFKQSGIGREGSHYGIEEFLETKFILLGS